MTITIEMQDAIIKRRLEVDERPLKRLSKRLLILGRDSQAVENGSELATLEADFATYNQTLRRLQLLLRANAKEVELYAEQRRSTEELYKAAQADIETLRNDLAEARIAREDRAFFDSIAVEIERNVPKTRRQLNQAIHNLEEEVVELENERKNYNAVWQTRKSGFDDIMSKLSELQKAISGEKADAELRDAADSDEEEGAIAGSSRTEDEVNQNPSDTAIQQSTKSSPKQTDIVEAKASRPVSPDLMDTS